MNVALEVLNILNGESSMPSLADVEEITEAKSSPELDKLVEAVTEYAKKNNLDPMPAKYSTTMKRFEIPALKGLITFTAKEVVHTDSKGDYSQQYIGILVSDKSFNKYVEQIRKDTGREVYAESWM